MSMTDKAVDLALSQLQRLRDAGTAVAIPSDDLAMRAVRGCIYKDKWRRTAPRKGEECARALWKYVKFHRSGGSLYGYPWEYSGVFNKDWGFTGEEIDTLAIVLLGGSRAADAWSKALS